MDGAVGPAETGLAARLRVRRGEDRRPTAGAAPGFVQANLAILPANLAADFLRFCQLQSEAVPAARHVGARRPADTRSRRRSRHPHRRAALPRLARRRAGRGAERPHGAAGATTWSPSCSAAPSRSRRRWSQTGSRCATSTQAATCRCTAPRSTTARPARSAGRMVVSMRPFTPADAIRAVQITSRFPSVHGAPVHIGLPAADRHQDIAKPDFGDPVDDPRRRAACVLGVRRHAAGGDRGVKPPFSITHAPGYMLVTDLKNAQLAIS